MNELKMNNARVVKNGYLYVLTFDRQMAKAQDIMQHCYQKKNGHMFVHIRPPKVIRSTGPGSQGNHFNGHVSQIAAYIGDTSESVKSDLKSMAVQWGYPQLENEEGTPLFDLRGNPIGISEADSTTEQCAILIEVAHMAAAQLEIELIEE